MASLKFYLARAESKETAILFRLSYGAYEIVNGKKNYISLRYYTNESINPEFWNTKDGKAKEKKISATLRV